jgi:hypothetical protein
MHRQVKYYVGGEFQSKDLRDMQAFKQEGVNAAAADLVGPGTYYANMRVAKASPITLTIEPGRLLKAGQYYDLPLAGSIPGQVAQVLQIAAHLPVVQNKIIAVCVWGREIETQVEQRSFRLDLVTETTEFRSVPVHRQWEAVIDVVDDGTESATPVVPVIPNGLLHVASVWLSPDGITRVEMVEANRLPNSTDLINSIRDIAIWQSRIEAQVDSLRQQFAALREMQWNFAKHIDVINMAVDVAILKRRAMLPTGTTNYGADVFEDDTYSAPNQSGYSARLDNGLLFPVAASATANLALLSPNDGAAQVRDGLLLPAYTTVQRFRSGDWDGQDVALAIEQSTWEYETIELNSWVNVKGWSFQHYAEWWSSKFARWGQTDYRVNRISRDSYVAQWLNDWNMNWTLQPVQVEVLKEGSTTQVSGATIAQTFVAPSMWLTEVDLHLTQAQAADVQLFVVKVSETGKPIMAQVMASAVVAAADLSIHPAPTRFTLNRPVFLQGGQRYAIAIVSAGIHRFATVSGAKFAEGTLFSSSSGDFFQGDQTKDLLFALRGAQFKYPRTTISLQPVSLAGGLTDLKLLTRKLVPSGCELEIQYQVNGTWHPISSPDYPLAAAPNLVPLRAVFLGTAAVQPAMVIQGGSTVEVSRPALSFTHISTVRSLPVASASFLVRVRSHRFDAGHDLGCALLIGSEVATPESSSMVVDQDGSQIHNFTFSLGQAITSYRIRLQGSRVSEALSPFTVAERIDVVTG